MKLLRTIRLDPSDTFVFERAAEPGEWAVSGAFIFADADPETLPGKPRAAFRSGFLGVPSLGWSTLVQIVEADAAELRGAAVVLGERRVGRPVGGLGDVGDAQRVDELAREHGVGDRRVFQVGREAPAGQRARGDKPDVALRVDRERREHDRLFDRLGRSGRRGRRLRQHPTRNQFEREQSQQAQPENGNARNGFHRCIGVWV